MQFSVAFDYPAGLDLLWRALGQREHTREKYLAQGSTDVRLTQFRATPELIEVDLQRKAPLAPEQLPGWTQPFVQAEQPVRHRSHWRRVDARHVVADISFEFAGIPAKAQAKGEIVELGPQHSRMAFQVSVTSSVPMLSHPIEQLLATQVKQAFHADHESTLDYLRTLGC